jgi:putative SOS response-associated peptidase YedK
LVKPLHDRIPAILSEEQFGLWLDPTESRAEKLLPLLAPYPGERMERRAVSERVNSATADGPDLLVAGAEPPKPSWTQPSLFEEDAA